MNSKSVTIERACPCCGACHPAPVFDNRMAPIGGLDMSYRVGRCRRCNFVYASELPRDEHYQRYYRILSKYDQIVTPSEIPAVDRMRAEAVLELCGRHLGKDDPVADLGCGVGHLLHAFQERGWWELYGLDPAPDAAERARSLFALEGVRSGLLADAGALLPLARVRLVCLTGVLEHLWCLREDFAALIGQLSPGTRILIEVPALERFTKPPFEPYGEFSLEHIQYFSSDTLSRFLASLGAFPLERRIIDLPAGTTDSLLGIFEVGGRQSSATISPTRRETDVLDDYLARSERLLEPALARIESCPANELVIYGAGSHTARLLPHLARLGLGPRIVAIVDGNTNLQGKRMADWTIQARQALHDHPAATVVVSSFRSQSAIASGLAQEFPNDVLRLY